MNKISDEEFEASLDEYYRQTESFRRMLEARTEEDVERDNYVLAQNSLGKRLKVVLRKASKKLNRPELAPESPDYAHWVSYYETFIEIIIHDQGIRAYFENKENMAKQNASISTKEHGLEKKQKEEPSS